MRLTGTTTLSQSGNESNGNKCGYSTLLRSLELEAYHQM